RAAVGIGRRGYSGQDVVRLDGVLEGYARLAAIACGHGALISARHAEIGHREVRDVEEEDPLTRGWWRAVRAFHLERATKADGSVAELGDLRMPFEPLGYLPGSRSGINDEGLISGPHGITLEPPVANFHHRATLPVVCGVEDDFSGLRDAVL